MPLPENIDDISAKVKQVLVGTPHECITLTPLSGGNANFVFQGKLAQATNKDKDGYVLIKHGEDYLASDHSLKLTTSRCKFEAESLRTLQRLSTSDTHAWEVKAPELYAFYEEFNIQIQEYLPQSMDLKSYAIKTFPAGTPESKWREMDRFGYFLGSWLGQFHEWAAKPEQSELKRVATMNKELQGLKHFVNYHYLIKAIDKFPAILENAREVFEQVRDMADAEIEDDSRLQVTHGDFWTGNILLRTDHEALSRPKPMRIVDWEVCSLGVRARDIGQMMAEIYQFKLFKDMDVGLWLMQEFTSGYDEATHGGLDLDTAFRAAIHLGMHLVVIGGSVAGWGTPEDVYRVVAMGRNIILMAWKQDKAWFEGGDLACLFRAAEERTKSTLAGS